MIFNYHLLFNKGDDCMNIYFENLHKVYDGKDVFRGIKGRLSLGDKIGIIGANGIGKSTLGRMLSGNEDYEKGTITTSPTDVKILYANPEIRCSDSIIDYINISVQKEISIEDLLPYCKALSLEESLLTSPISSLSGGEKTKVMLLKAVLSTFDVLILDEPTNHLDINTTLWIEEFLRDKTFIVISHDRYFLDKVVNKIWLLTAKELKEYKGNYTKFKNQKNLEDKTKLREYEKQQDQIDKLNKIIDERKRWFISAHNSAGQNDFLRSKSKKHVSILRSKEKELARLEENLVEKPKNDYPPAFNIINNAVINLKLPKYILQIKDLSMSFDDRSLFENISFDITRGEKAALIGNNGCGKTTLLKIIIGEIKASSGKVLINPSIKLGYFSQELYTLDYDKNILDNVLSEGVNQNDARLLLSTLMFKGDTVFKSISVLSMGEKTRVAFAKLILSGANMLILDEPTNYLDMVSREKIEEVLSMYKGAILFVSHDRYFIKNLADKILEFDGKSLLVHNYGYEEYIERKNSLNHNTNEDDILKLELELAYISGKLADPLLEPSEKELLDKRFIHIYRNINLLKNK